MMNPKIFSVFVANLSELSKDELWDIILYCSKHANNEEDWEVEINNQYHWINGSARGNDTGMFYQFLIANNLDKKIEIIRG